MDFFPLISPEHIPSESLANAQDACWQAQQEIADRTDSLLSQLALPLAKGDAAVDAAIISLFRRMKAAVNRGCKPLDTAINALLDGFHQRIQEGVELLDRQIAVVRAGLLRPPIQGEPDPVGGWWEDDDDSVTPNLVFVPGSPLPPTAPGNWRGPYGSRDAAQQAWFQRHPHPLSGGPPTPPPFRPLRPLAPPTPTPPFQPPTTPAPVSPPRQPPLRPPGPQPLPTPTPLPVTPLPTPQPLPTPTPLFPPSPPQTEGPQQTVIGPPQTVGPQQTTTQGPQPTQTQPPGGTCPAPVVQCPSPVVDVTVQVTPDVLTAPAVTRRTPPRLSGQNGVGPCGIDPSQLSQIIGVVNIPAAWYPSEEADADSECGTDRIEAARSRRLPADLIASVYEANDPVAALESIIQAVGLSEDAMTEDDFSTSVR